MALKRPFQPLDTFSMSSMTDIVFLLLIFFMVTSTIFPAAIDVNLPQSSEQTSTKPVTEVYVTRTDSIFLVEDRNDSTNLLSAPRYIADLEILNTELQRIQSKDSTRAVALYADSAVIYAKVVNVLDMAARNKLRMVLSTRARQN